MVHIDSTLNSQKTIMFVKVKTKTGKTTLSGCVDLHGNSTGRAYFIRAELLKNELNQLLAIAENSLTANQFYL